MINYKSIKKESKSKIRINYWRNVFMAMLVIITTTGVLNSFLLKLSGESGTSDTSGSYGWLFIKYIVRFYYPNFLIPNPSNTNEIQLFTFLESLGSSGTTLLTSEISFPLYIGYSILNAHEANSVNAIWAAIIGCLLFFAFIAFFLHPINIGSKYYFLKKIKSEQDDEKNAILEGGFNHFYLNIVFTRLLKSVIFSLSCLTIVGGFILYFSYYFVDYIIMDNPSLNPIQTLRLSRQMMKGHKWELFLLMLSFIGWKLLSIITFGILDPLFLKPYQELCFSKYYLTVKDTFAQKNPRVYSISYLQIYEENSKSLFLRSNTNYDVQYEIVDYALIFFIISFGGWCWEVFYNFIRTFQFANRGTLWGPVLPIYGTGAVLALFLLKKFRKVPWLSFILSIIVCLTIEYFTGFFIEKTKGVRYWSYDSMPFNLNGRICLFGGLLFGIGCLFAIYFVGPGLYPILHKISNKNRWIITAVCTALILIDTIISKFYPNPDGMEAIDKLSLIFFLNNTNLNDIVINAFCKLTFVPLDCHV